MRILIAEDDSVSRRLVQSALTKWGYEVLMCADGEEAWKVLQGDDPPRMAILNWMMPGLDGIEVCRRVRQQNTTPYTYIILLTARTGKEDIVEGLEVGADDYVTKPFHPQELKVRLRAGRRILDLQESLLSLQETLREQATHDPLTGAWNRTSIVDILQKEIARGDRDGSSVAVVMADLDHFKRVNDTYGHLAGDAVLRETVRRVKGSMRLYDHLGRYGGEEFLMVLSRCDRETALAASERIRRSVSDRAMDTPEGRIPVTLSLGIALSDREHHDVEELLRAADLALYRAKRNGRNRIEAADLSLIRPEARQHSMVA